MNEKLTTFGPFRLDMSNECLWKGTRALKLRPKAFAVLDYLLRRPGQLVTKEDLLSAVWPETFVGEAVLKVAIRQIRQVLDDDPASPRFIETAHRRGYRFIGSAGSNVQAASDNRGVSKERDVQGSPRALPKAQRVVGRDGVVLRLNGCLGRALDGQRQIVFVTGEAGIGKTSVVDAFLGMIDSDSAIWISRGQCLEQYGTGEAYLPVLEAIGRLCRERKNVVEVLRAHAPMWLLQMPSLLSAPDRELLSRSASGATRERMLREISDALEALTAERPLVMILEDLHWSDYSTLDLISYLARQRQPAKLMLIGTYRTVELIVSGHPLKTVKRELMAKQQCVELPLEYLSEDAIASYLDLRFPVNGFSAKLATLIHERTEGNPLFMINAVDYLIAEESIVARKGRWELVSDIGDVVVGVPDSIKQMIEKQVDHLDAEQQRTLEAASVAGAEFSALAVAAGLGTDRGTVERCCDELSRHRQFLADRGVQELPGGEAMPRYGFIHALYQNVLYERLSASRRVQLHRRIGTHGEEFYGERAAEMAAELAMHFERGANYARAVNYLQQAAENAIRRFAYREAVGLSRQGLELIHRLPETRERNVQELRLHITLGVPLIATEGYAAPDVGSNYTRARELCRQLGEPPETSEVLWGLWTFYLVRAELGTARAISEEFLRLAPQLPYPGVAMEITLMHLGELSPAMKNFEKAFALYDPERHRDDALRYSQNSGVGMQCHAAWTLWFLGLPDQAIARVNEGLALARHLAEPHGIAHALFFVALLHQLRREEQVALQQAEAAIAISGEHELTLYETMSAITRGWALAALGHPGQAIEQMRIALAAHEATGTQLVRPQFLGLFAEVLGKAHQFEEGLRVLDEALTMAHRNREVYYQPELYRLRGELLLMQSPRGAVSQAEELFQKAIRIAHDQGGKSLELRAANSLVRLHRSQGRHKKSHGLLSQIYAQFTEGFDTPDLQEARTMLNQGRSA